MPISSWEADFFQNGGAIFSRGADFFRWGAPVFSYTQLPFSYTCAKLPERFCQKQLFTPSHFKSACCSVGEGLNDFFEQLERTGEITIQTPDPPFLASRGSKRLLRRRAEGKGGATAAEAVRASRPLYLQVKKEG